MTCDSGTCDVEGWQGMELYPRIGKYFDIKTFTNCRFGMMSWAVLILCYFAKQVSRPSPHGPLFSCLPFPATSASAVSSVRLLCPLASALWPLSCSIHASLRSSSLGCISSMPFLCPSSSTLPLASVGFHRCVSSVLFPFTRKEPSSLDVLSV